MSEKLIGLMLKIIQFSETMEVKGPHTIKHGYYSKTLLQFFDRQNEHLKSVNILCKENQALDAMIIARTMAVGTAQIRWIALDPDRAKVYFTFGKLVHCLKTHFYQPLSQIEMNFMRENYSTFLSYDAKKDTKWNNAIPWERKKYVKDWFCAIQPNLSTSKLLKETGLDRDLLFYDPASNIEHWEPWITEALTDATESEISMNTDSKELALLALNVAIKSHILMMELICHHFEKDIGKQIADFEKEMEMAIAYEIELANQNN